MKSKYNSDQISAIENTVKHFEHWRATTERGQRRMSDELRSMAIDLSHEVGVHRASKELGLNCTDLKRWKDKAEPRASGVFTEISLRPSLPFSYRMEIKKNDTCISLSLDHSSIDQMVALIKGVL
jgi:transposase-like protein